MNPYYQYAIAKGYYNADAVMRQASTNISAPLQDEIISDSISQVGESMSEPAPTSPVIRPTTPVQISPDLDSTPLVNTLGDTQIKPVGGTTINIFNPDGQTSTTTTAEDVALDTLTGDLETGTDIGGGGFGGGGGMGSEGDAGTVEIMAVPVKTWIPLIVIAVGVAVIILNPFKKKAA